ncbi:uncharacterized protein HKW66_Vig0062150 [Vigna angularis]|uniref:Anticodon-binding domain-containing protein n=1 Tax=Phaseolus angularis TaxID=3914 RepID=A0A8T0L463_PHAAN|nr:uncharacterized protein HKW66_Vig0062150 [Vigna angularis]
MNILVVGFEVSFINFVREAQLAQYKYMLVVGEEEANTGQVFASDIGCRSDDLPPTCSVDDILSKLISPVYNDKHESSGSNKNN